MNFNFVVYTKSYWVSLINNWTELKCLIFSKLFFFFPFSGLIRELEPGNFNNLPSLDWTRPQIMPSLFYFSTHLFYCILWSTQRGNFLPFSGVVFFFFFNKYLVATCKNSEHMTRFLHFVNGGQKGVYLKKALEKN